MAGRNFIKKVAGKVLKPMAKWYFSKPRRWRYLAGKQSLDLIVLPGVFHPHLTISTKQFLQFLSDKKLAGNAVLELGCGSGALSVYCALEQASVTASDIHPKATENVLLNAKRHAVNVEVFKSDLFASIPEQQFDLILINPPYYPQEPKDDAEKAWFCGADFQYFEGLFEQMDAYLTAQGKAWMILSEDCDVQRIGAIAESHQWQFRKILENKVMREQQYIFECYLHQQ